MTTIQIKGLDKLQIKFDGIEPAIRAGIKASTVHIKGKAAEYPQATIANDPGQKRWYERGWGSKWHVRGGGWHGRKSSETLGKKWTVEFTNNGMTARIGNNVSYGKWVQSPEYQARALKRIGWKTTEQIAEDERETVEKFIKSQIDKALSK
jgi:hypothetical protein